MDRRLSVCADGGSPGRRYVVARVSDDPALPCSPLSRIETAVLVRVLWGEQQKLVAAELGIACSTASKWYTQALAKMQLPRGPLAVPLVIAAQAWSSGHNPPVDARSAHFEHDGSQYFVLSVPKPTVTTQGALTPAECDVARFLVEGESRWDIAARRETSAQTVACQIRGIFSKWRLTGRYALIRHTAELGWMR
jgi:DNA-binding NarL/FixJ family response regulator